MSDANPQPATTQPPPVPTSPFEHRLMFVVFVLLALVLFLPTVLLPEVRDYCLLLEEEARLQERVTGLETELARREALVEAFRNDVVINERLAMIDLNYRKPGVEVLPLPPLAGDLVQEPKPAANAAHVSALKIPADAPARVREAEAWAERHGLIDLFLDPELKVVFLLMAGGLIVAAFVLFAPRMAPDPRHIRKSPSARTPALLSSVAQHSSVKPTTTEAAGHAAPAGPAA